MARASSMLASLLFVCVPLLLVVLLDLLLPPALNSPASSTAEAPALATTCSTRSSTRPGDSTSIPRSSTCPSSPPRAPLSSSAHTRRWGGKHGLLVGGGGATDGGGLELQGKGQAMAVEAMFLSTLALAAAHFSMTYRASCREKRRLHIIYRINIKAVCTFSLILKNAASLLDNKDPLKVEADARLTDLIWLSDLGTTVEISNFEFNNDR